MIVKITFQYNHIWSILGLIQSNMALQSKYLKGRSGFNLNVVYFNVADSIQAVYLMFFAELDCFLKETYKTDFALYGTGEP